MAGRMPVSRTSSVFSSCGLRLDSYMTGLDVEDILALF